MYVCTYPDCECSISAFTHPIVIKASDDACFYSIPCYNNLYKLGHTILLA